MTLTKVTEATTDKVRFLRVLEVRFLEFKKLESEAEDRPQARVNVTFPLETVMTLTKVTEATSDKVRFLEVIVKFLEF